MDQVLKPHQEYASAYLDDVVIQSPDWESHLPRVQKVLESLPRNVSWPSVRRTTWGAPSGGASSNLRRQNSAILDWPKPLTKKQVRSFLGLANYYRRFIPYFAMVAAPLTELTVKKHSRMVKWTPVAEEAFDNLKRALCSKPVLTVPDFSKEFVIQADASEVLWALCRPRSRNVRNTQSFI